VVREAGS